MPMTTESFEPEEYQELEGLEESYVHCPKCLTEEKYVKMVILQKGNTTDDFVTILICPICYHQERE